MSSPSGGCVQIFSPYSIVVLQFFLTCRNLGSKDGPLFGNGTRNSARMTRQPEIIKNLIPVGEGRPVPALNDPIGFGRTRTNHMLVCDFDAQLGGWQTPKIVPYGSFDLSPDSLIFHYGQEVFEGMKAYRSMADSKEIFLFRPKENAKRFSILQCVSEWSQFQKNSFSDVLRK